MITNPDSGTRIDEIADGIFRINTPIALPGDGGAFSFNQYLVVDDEPLLFHTGPRRMYPLVSQAIAQVMPLERLRYLGLSHFEADECGALADFVSATPHAVALCGGIAAMTSVGDATDRPPRVMTDGEDLSLGRHVVRWFDTPHVPHGWECGLMMERTTGTFLCGDLFTQPGDGAQALTSADILGPSEALRAQMDYFSHAPDTAGVLERLAAQAPTTLACMHGSAWRGDGAALLRAYAQSLVQERVH
jgi:flavorubredoxin